MYLKKIIFADVVWFRASQVWVKWQAFVVSAVNIGASIKSGQFFEQLDDEPG
jgi:hypothetical protein